MLYNHIVGDLIFVIFLEFKLEERIDFWDIFSYSFRRYSNERGIEFLVLYSSLIKDRYKIKKN